MPDGALLALDDVSVRYPNGAHGVRGLRLHVHPGEVVALLGRNGAGKTSSLRSIAGYLRSEQTRVGGSILLDGKQIAGRSPMQVFKKGLVFVQERDKVFANLTVAEHLRLVSRDKRSSHFEPLDRLLASPAGFLSGGERQMLALELALRSRPRMLLVDELSLGLAPIVVKDLLAQVRALASEQGIAVLLVEQDAHAALHIADRAYALSNGELVWSGAAKDADEATLARAYLGVRA